MTIQPVTRAAALLPAALLLCGVGCQVPGLADAAAGPHPAEGVVRLGGTPAVVRAQSPEVGTCPTGTCQSGTCQPGTCQSGTCPGGVVGGRGRSKAA